MLNDVVIQYFERFNNLMTESVYASKGIDDYNRMKKYCDYLDYTSETLFRDKTKSQTGLRNIGNTCYLNVILQLLFHINYLREKICCSDHQKSALIMQLRSLFGEMAVGKFLFADPTDLFEYLKVSNPDIFVAGVQNDFHEIFTLLIDKISESYKQISIEESRFINKLLFGKLLTKIDFVEGKASNVTTFNIINLEVAEGSFEKGFDKWKNYKINDYLTPKGHTVEATAENVFLETPALMAFFINRVSYKNNSLQKDNRVFEFQSSILVNKSQQSEKTKIIKAKTNQLEAELKQEKATLTIWLQKIKNQKAHIQETIKYLKQKQTPLLSAPNVENQMDEKHIAFTIKYLQQQIQLICRKINDVEKDIKVIEAKLIKLEEQGNYESYVLWALMIHEGKTAGYGHYKVCIHLGGDIWNEYNDKTVTSISKDRIQAYKEKGQICCLFYRRPTLICDGSRIPIPHALKNMVNQQQKQIKKQIDKARLLQSLYQQTQSSNIILDYQVRLQSNQKCQYFFKAVHYALNEKYPFETCKGIIIFEIINSDAYKNALANKFVSEDSDLNFTRLTFGIPQQYFNASQILKDFLNKQASLHSVAAAYEQISNKKVKFNKKTIKEKYEQMIQVIILKGIYYLKFFADHYCAEVEHHFNKLNKGVDDILANLNQASEFVLVSITIKSSIKPVVNAGNKLKITPKGIAIDDYGQYFSQNFKFWIAQRQNLSKLDESNFDKSAPIVSQLRE